MAIVTFLFGFTIGVVTVIICTIVCMIFLTATLNHEQALAEEKRAQQLMEKEPEITRECNTFVKCQFNSKDSRSDAQKCFVIAKGDVLEIYKDRELQEMIIPQISLSNCQFELVKKKKSAFHKANILHLSNPQQLICADSNEIFFFFDFGRDLEALFNHIDFVKQPDSKISKLKEMTFIKDQINTISEQQQILKHSETGNHEMFALLNSILIRAFFAIHRSVTVEKIIRENIEKEIKKKKLPDALKSVHISGIRFGQNVPIVRAVSLVEQDSTGRLALDVDFEYEGGLNATVELVVKKLITMNMNFVVTLKKAKGTLRVLMLPFPSTRIWIGFTKLPETDIDFKTTVKSFDISFGSLPKIQDLILKFINKELTDILVLPNMEDIKISILEKKNFGDLANPSPILQQPASDKKATVHEKELPKLPTEARKQSDNSGSPKMDECDVDSKDTSLVGIDKSESREEEKEKGDERDFYKNKHVFVIHEKRLPQLPEQKNVHEHGALKKESEEQCKHNKELGSSLDTTNKFNIAEKGSSIDQENNNLQQVKNSTTNECDHSSNKYLTNNSSTNNNEEENGQIRQTMHFGPSQEIALQKENEISTETEFSPKEHFEMKMQDKELPQLPPKDNSKKHSPPLPQKNDLQSLSLDASGKSTPPMLPSKSIANNNSQKEEMQKPLPTVPSNETTDSSSEKSLPELPQKEHKQLPQLPK